MRSNALRKAAAELPWVPLGTLLVRAEILTDEELGAVLAIEEETHRRLGEIVVDLGYATEAQVAAALAEQYELEFLDLDRLEIDRPVAVLLAETLAHRCAALPVRRLPDGAVLVAVADPTDVIAADHLRLAVGANIRLAVCERRPLERAIARVHRHRIEAAPNVSADERAERSDIRDVASSAPTVNLVNSVLTHAIEEGASDVRFEPRSSEFLVRARVDGVMRNLTTIPRHMQAAVTSRLKIMASLDIAERRLPQDGRVSTHFDDEPIDLRIAVLPTRFGEQVVLRLGSRAKRPARLDELGMADHAEGALRTVLARPHGAVLVVGPTGSGKTTTLYALLDTLNTHDRVLTTIEDPVEHQVDGAAQVEVDTRAGLTFARGLRTILRSDPDVLLVGEIRDEETAAVSMQAALTGHLVLTSFHARDAAAAVARLVDLGVTAKLVGAALNCVVAQRLARRLCGECRKAVTVDATPFTEVLDGDVETVQVYEADGCAACSGSGYRGRVPLVEVMPITTRLRRLIDGPAEALAAAAVEEGMVPLRQVGLRLCLDGVCSPAEITRVIDGS
jgi:type IV pilus assembly protein PilB